MDSITIALLALTGLLLMLCTLLRGRDMSGVQYDLALLPEGYPGEGVSFVVYIDGEQQVLSELEERLCFAVYTDVKLSPDKLLHYGRKYVEGFDQGPVLAAIERLTNMGVFKIDQHGRYRIAAKAA